MAFDPGAILQLPNAVRAALDAGGGIGRSLGIAEQPGFCVALIGPVDAGKTALVHALLGKPIYSIPSLSERPGRDTMVPVEYVYGPELRLMLWIGKGRRAAQRWVDGRLDDPGALRRPDLYFVRVAVPSEALSDWSLRIIDFPSIEGADELLHEQFSALWQGDTAAFYVVPGRGLTDTDAQALELLRRRPVAVIENLREEELLPTRSVIESVELPGLTCPLVIPILGFRTRGAVRTQGERERELLRKCISLLRLESLPPQHLHELLKRTELSRAALRSEASSRLARIHARCAEPDPLQHLFAVHGALSLERESAKLAELDDLLTRLMELAAMSDGSSSATLRKLLRDGVTQAVDQYNIEAGRRSVDRPFESTARVMDFGARYVEGREELEGCLRNILDRVDELDLTSGERDSLRHLIASIHGDRIDIALLGRFSSGKSSLINALLGVQVDDRKPKLLPTSARPETATVNYLEYDKGTVLRAVSWLEQASLTFLSETGDPGQVRVHVDEIQAFHAWLDAGAVDASRCTFTYLSPSTAPTKRSAGRGRPDPVGAFRSLWRALEFPKPPFRFAYLPGDRRTPHLPGGVIPAGVDIRRFDRKVADWPRSPTLSQAFAAVRQDPAVALRVKSLHVGFDHPLLQHATIIDTPGTDAPIPHHRTVAREIINGKRCPVLYCFLSTKAGGREDRENLRVLKEWGIGKADLSRFFFVITKRGEVPVEDHEEVRSVVEACLAEVGISASQMYFTEVVQEQNDDFQSLKRDVGRFAANSRGPLFSSWVANARQVLTGVHDRYAKRLVNMAEDERTRDRREQGLQRDSDVVAAITSEFENSGHWGVEWAKGRFSKALEPKLDDVDAIIDALTTRDEFEGIEEELASAIGDVNTDTRRFIGSINEGMSGKLKSLVAERLPGRSIEFRPFVTQDDFFGSAETLEAVGRIEWRGFFKKVWKLFSEDWDKDIAENRKRIADPWRKSRDTGEKLVKEQVKATIEHLRRELRRISEGIDAELRQSREREPPERAATIQEQRKKAAAWLHRFDALERKFKGARA